MSRRDIFGWSYPPGCSGPPEDYNEPRCERCGTNYQRVICDKCGKQICMHCAYAPSDVRVWCIAHKEE